MWGFFFIVNHFSLTLFSLRGHVATVIVLTSPRYVYMDRVLSEDDVAVVFQPSVAFIKVVVTLSWFISVFPFFTWKMCTSCFNMTFSTPLVIQYLLLFVFIHRRNGNLKRNYKSLKKKP